VAGTDILTASDANAAWLAPGEIVHRRLRPREHALAYRVTVLIVDLDRVDVATARLRWFSHNRFNLVSLHDRDHLTGAASGLAAEARAMFADAGFPTDGHRILLVAYPRLLGYVFNPLSVFLLLSPDGAIAAVAYEVNNTFGERKCYVVAAGRAEAGVHAHGCAKELFVSPFTPSDGRYTFRLALDASRVLVAVLLRDHDGALLKTRFSASPQPMTDASLLRLAAGRPFMTLHVIAAIHWHAARLWLKGVRLQRRRRSPKFSISRVPSPESATPSPARDLDAA
jgi:hypothetical protein